MTTTLCGVIVLLLTFVVYYLWRVKAALGLNTNVFNVLQTDLLATRDQIERQISRLLDGTQWMQDEFGDADDSEFRALPGDQPDGQLISSTVEMAVQAHGAANQLGDRIYVITFSGGIRFSPPADWDAKPPDDDDLRRLLSGVLDPEET